MTGNIHPEVSDLVLRQMMCDVIELAVKNAKGKDVAWLANCNGREYQRMKHKCIVEAKEYIASVGFREDCDFVGLDAWEIRRELEKPKRSQYVFQNARIRQLEFAV